MQCIISDCLGRGIKLVAEVDSTQAATTVGRGYNKKLKHLTRGRRVMTGFVRDLVCEGCDAEMNNCLSVEQNA